MTQVNLQPELAEQIQALADLVGISTPDMIQLAFNTLVRDYYYCEPETVKDEEDDELYEVGDFWGKHSEPIDSEYSTDYLLSAPESG